MDDTRKVTFSIQEDADVLDRLDRLAEKEGTSRSAIIRRAIRQLLFSLSIVPENGNSPETDQP